MTQQTVKESLAKHAKDTAKGAAYGAAGGAARGAAAGGAGAAAGAAVGAVAGAVVTQIKTVVEAGSEAYELHKAEQEQERAENEADLQQKVLEEKRAHPERDVGDIRAEIEGR